MMRAVLAFGPMTATERSLARSRGRRPEEFVQEVGVLALRLAVDEVVGGHEGPGLRFEDGGLEGAEVDFAQGALIHLGVDGVALELLLVGDVMLDGGAHSLALEAVDVGY